jgi:hypothetical protein
MREYTQRERFVRQSRYGPNVRPPVIDGALAEELAAYRGRWVAIQDGHVVAAADDLRGVLQHARERGVPDPLVYQVPTHPHRKAFRSALRDAVV